MPFPFGKSHKSPADIVKNLKDSMAVLEKQDISDKKAEKVVCLFLMGFHLLLNFPFPFHSYRFYSVIYGLTIIYVA